MAVGWLLSHMTVSPVAHSQDAKPAAKPAPMDELAALKASAAAFETAFNAGDAKAIAAQFLERAEAVDEDGNVLAGREEIEARFANLFQEYPKARIAVELSSLRQLGPNVAVEEGFSTTTLDPAEPGSRSPYTLVHVRQNDKWLIASVRDFPADAPAVTAHDQLQSLAWLVGHWVDESPEGRVETTCQWSDDGNYLLQDYVVKSPRGEMRGTQRIGWDGMRQTIRSWAFDHNGSFTEGVWTPTDRGWILKIDGVTPEGQGASATRVVTMLNSDAFQIDSSNVIVGHELLPESTVRVVRQPPQPGS